MTSVLFLFSHNSVPWERDQWARGATAPSVIVDLTLPHHGQQAACGVRPCPRTRAVLCPSHLPVLSSAGDPGPDAQYSVQEGASKTQSFLGRHESVAESFPSASRALHFREMWVTVVRAVGPPERPGTFQCVAVS